MINQDTFDMVLQQYPVLLSTDKDTLDVLMASATKITVPAGSVMFDEDQACAGFAFLLSGHGRVVKTSSGGRELHLYDVKPGEACILTSSCLLGKSNYRARCTMSKRTDLVFLPPATFRLLFSVSEPFREFIFSRYSARLSDLLDLVSSVTFQKLDQRLAAWLVQRTDVIHITHQALANDLGSVREIISRSLKGFAKKGWVVLGREKIEVIDPAALRRLIADSK